MNPTFEDATFLIIKKVEIFTPSDKPYIMIPLLLRPKTRSIILGNDIPQCTSARIFIKDDHQINFINKPIFNFDTKYDIL